MSAAAYIDQVVAIERGRGTKITRAIEVAAEVIGMSPRKAYSVHYQQPVVVRPEEVGPMRARVRAWLAADLARQEARIAIIRAQLDAMEADG